MILKNVELYWVRLDPANPDMGFSGDKPQWNVQMRTSDPAQAKEWSSIGLNVQEKEDQEGNSFFQSTVRKDAFRKNGQPNEQVRIVDAQRLPFSGDIASIGNGTVANVRLRQFDWEFKGRKGVGIRLDAIQIVELVTYQGGGGDDFEVLEVPNVSTEDEDLF